MSLQPSEFLKPTLRRRRRLAVRRAARPQPAFPATAIAIALYRRRSSALLLKQPDVGMTVVVTAIWFAAVLPRRAAARTGSRRWLVARRRRAGRRLFPASRTSPAASTASSIPQPATPIRSTARCEAFSNGGLFGRGPGEGTVKDCAARRPCRLRLRRRRRGVRPDRLPRHRRAVRLHRAARLLARCCRRTTCSSLLAATGLLTQFGLQAIINMASTLHLMPTKGMTLPFICYGGSSMLALALGMGMLLALTRRALSARPS